jgi:hypothetical protein
MRKGPVIAFWIWGAVLGVAAMGYGIYEGIVWVTHHVE